MVCLDKDCVLGSSLSSFLDTLESLPNIKYGLCELNVSESSINKFFTKQSECFNFFAYGSRHPSGMFWNSELFKSCSVVPKILKSKVVFGFFTELIFSECCSKTGNGLYYKKPLIVTETLEEAAKKKTLTYNISQIFFFPKNRIFEFNVYLGQLQTLKVKNKIILWLKVFRRGLVVSTLGFRGTMKNALILQHYGLTTRKIGIFELIAIAFRYVFSILFSFRKRAFYSLFNFENKGNIA